jgi:hypothetical protein
MSVGHRTKKLVWKRDGGRCFYCGTALTWGTKTVDHVIPKSKGGPHRAWNIVISCLACNQEKGDSDPTHEQLDIVSVEKAVAMARTLNDDSEIQDLLKLRDDILEVIHSRRPKKYLIIGSNWLPNLL